MRNYYINELQKFKDVYLDYPFEDTDYATIRHKDNKKIFAIIFTRNGNVCINFKNRPQWGALWRGSFESVTPGFHMNKEHWSTVVVGGDAGHEQIMEMVTESYNLTKTKRRRK